MTRRDEFVQPSGFEREIPEATAKPQSPALPAAGGKPLPLAARSKSGKSAGRSATLTKPTESLITVGGSLCVVLSLFFGVAWLTRRGGTKHVTKLPGEVIEVLGKAPLVKGQDMQLVRIGAKLLLICVTPHGCETLTEITDDREVEHLSAICRRNNPNSVTAAFNQVLANMGREPASGFSGDARTSNDRRGVRYHA
jgi:flagellar biogenesis protein FliO